jgi:Transcriptional regulator, AbiEi antitoxin/Protein of unknown function (DUF559)
MDQKGDTADRRIARIAERQHGAVTLEQLRHAGISSDAISGRVRTGRIYRIHRGVYALGQARLSPEGKCMAAVLACGSAATKASERDDDGASTLPVLAFWGAALSHYSAAALWGLLPSRSALVDVSVPGTAGRKRHRGIRLHRSRTLRAGLVTSRSGIPITTPARTIEDLRRTAPPADVRRAIRQAEVLGLPIDEIASDGTRSELEGLFLRLCNRSELPMPDVNVRIGPFLVDFLWRDRRLIVETDGYRFHRGRAAFEDDHDRDLKLKSLGYEVIHLTHRQVVDEPSRVAKTLAAVLTSGSLDREVGDGG